MNSGTLLHNVAFSTTSGEITREALAAGCKYFDLTDSGKALAEVGAVLRAAASADNEPLRSKLCITAKLVGLNDSAPDKVEAACRSILAKTGLDYLDCLVVHHQQLMNAPSPRKVNTVQEEESESLLSSWRAMEALVTLGLVKNLGVSHFNEVPLKQLLANATIMPVLNEVELHPHLTQPTLVIFCENHDIHLVAALPLGEAGVPVLLNDPLVVALAAEIGKTPAQVCLRWGVQNGYTVMLSQTTEHSAAETLDVVAWRLSRKAMDLLNALNQGLRFFKPAWCPFDESAFPKDIQLPKKQPEVIKGCVDPLTGDYHNAFYRAGKPLHTDITIKTGILSNLGTRAQTLLPPLCYEAPNFLVTDEICDRAFGATVLEGLRAAGYRVTKVVIPADEIDEAGVSGTEAYKTTGVLSQCYDEILGTGISKHSCIISLGGGVVNNICGMIASTLYRGISLVHFTTTSMGMADAAIDFKQAVNHSLGKNLIGCYYPASRVVIDTEVLAHLAPRHILNGLAEALKHGLAQSAELTEFIVAPFRERGVDAALADPTVLDGIIKACIEYKTPTLIYYHDSDLNEMAPQYGHCVGHAVEYTSYHDGVSSALLHGEAVSIGMCVSADIAFLMGLCDEKCVAETYLACETVGLPVHVPGTMDLEAVKKKMTYDKHFVKFPTMGVPVKVGELYSFPKADGSGVSYMVEVSPDIINGALERNVARRDAMAAMRGIPIVAARKIKGEKSSKSSSPAASSEEEDQPAVATAEAMPLCRSDASPTSPPSPFGLPDGRGQPFAPVRKSPSGTNLVQDEIIVNGVALEEVFFLKYVKSSEDLRSINDFRAEYVKFRGGDAKGAEGEVTKMPKRIGSEPNAYMSKGSISHLPTALICMHCNL